MITLDHTARTVRRRARLSPARVRLLLWWGWWAVALLHTPAALFVGYWAVVSLYAWVAVAVAVAWAMGARARWDGEGAGDE
jgi:hypothetical protein